MPTEEGGHPAPGQAPALHAFASSSPKPPFTPFDRGADGGADGGGVSWSGLQSWHRAGWDWSRDPAAPVLGALAGASPERRGLSPERVRPPAATQRTVWETAGAQRGGQALGVGTWRDTVAKETLPASPPGGTPAPSPNPALFSFSWNCFGLPGFSGPHCLLGLTGCVWGCGEGRGGQLLPVQPQGIPSLSVPRLLCL